jgi:hypothetical protein
VAFAHYGRERIPIVEPNLKMLTGNNRAIIYLGGLLLAYLVAGLIIFRQEVKVGEKLVYLSTWLSLPVLIYGFVTYDFLLISVSCATVAFFGLVEFLRS